MSVQVRRATAEDWRLFRDLRLEALQDAPLAFASTHAREIAFTEDIWRSRTQTSAMFLAFDGDDLVGTASGYTDPDGDPDTTLLVAMYVVPRARGRRVAEQLIDAVVSDARSSGRVRVVLAVVEINQAGRRAYERYGFVETGLTHPLPHAPELTEIEFQLLL